MKTSEDQAAAAELCARAEAAFHAGAPLSPERLKALTPEAVAALVHELSVHQIELEMQNEELRRAQAELEASRERYFDLYDVAPVGYCTVTANGSVLEANLTLATLLGVPRGRLVGRPFSRFIFAGDEDLFYLLGKQVLAISPAGAAPVATSSSRELRLQQSDGAPVWVSVVAKAAMGNSGERVLRVVVTDITARRAGEAAARQAEAQLRASLTENADLRAALDEHAIVAVTDARGRLTFANDKFCAISGYSREELLGRDHGIINSGEHPEELFHEVWTTIQSGRVWQGEIHNRAKDGALYWLSMTIVPFVDDSGDIRQYLGISADITERKRIEARFRRLVDSDAQGILFWERAGAITEANDAFLSLVGYTRDDLVAGRLDWVAMTPPEYAPADEQALRELAASERCVPFEKEYLRKDGSRVSVLLGAASFDDQPGAGFAFVVDLTERKKVEQQLLQSQRLESIGTLAGGIAHDLNNMLVPIILSIELLKCNHTSPEDLELIETIEQSAQRGASLVRQILNFSRGAASRRVPMDLAQPLGELEKILRDTFPKSIDLRVVIARDLWCLTGDPTQLYQVFLNLCVNARDAMHGGGALVITVENAILDAADVRFLTGARPGKYVVVKVSDTGAGMAPDISERIFEPFFTTKEVGTGTGLGLSTVRGIVRRHDGFIQVRSELARGTTFTIGLPADASLAAPDRADVVNVERRRAHGETILVVDDDESVRKVAKQILERAGYQVLLAVHGVQGLEVYSARRAAIALVVTDLAMPVMDGAAFSLALKRLDANLRVLAISGFASDEQVAELLRNGVMAFLHKPFTAAVLLAAVSGALQSST
jgi:PAS domain S-box-containing protein